MTLSQAPPPPPAPFQFGESGDNVVALQHVLIALGYLRCGPWHLAKKQFGKRTYDAVCRFQLEHGLQCTGIYDEGTRVALVSKLQRLKESFSPSAAEHSNVKQEVEITDTDGDVIRFGLSEDGRRVVEYVNGKVELESVTCLKVDESSGVVIDPLGRFTVKEEDRAVKLALLRELMSSVGVEITPISVAPARSATVEIDLDLNASPERMNEQQRAASDAIRKACSSLGAVSQEAAQNLFSHLFESVASAISESKIEPKVDRLEESFPEVVKPTTEVTTCAACQSDFAYEQQLVDILEMGFEDVELISELLVKHCGNICHVVTELSDRSV